MKKFLALVLALIMTASLVTISAGAKDFADADAITYTEAVDVMTAIGVIDGYTDGTFGPAGNLTRGAAAKIICNMILTPTTAGALVADAAPYADVPADHVFAGYIAYLAKEGLISGYADGTFKPAAPLTGYAFMKMLLGVAGYDAAIEGYTGSNWSINVAKQGLANDLLNGYVGTFNGTATVNRETAMLLAFNTVKGPYVEYDNKSTIKVGDIVVSSTSEADVKGTVNSKYFSNLVGTPGDNDFGQPATTWTLKSATIGTYAKAPVLTYTDAVAGKTIFADLGKDAYTYYTADSDALVEAKEFTRFVDGTAGNTGALTIAKTETGKFGGLGALTEVYFDVDTNTVTVVTINTYVAQVVGDYNTTAETLTITFADYIGGAATTLSSDDYEGLEAFEDEDVVLVTIANDGTDYVASIETAESVKGAVSAYTATKSVTVAGTKYSYNCQAATAAAATPSINAEMIAYLDTYGNIVFVDGVDAKAEDYVFVTQVKPTSELAVSSSFVAGAYFTDGTYKEIKVVKNNNGYTPADEYLNAWCTFSVKDGEYKLTVVGSNVEAYAKNDNDEKVVENSKVAMNIGAGTSLASNKTIFVVVDLADNNKVAAYTGIKTAPSITAAATSTTYSAAVENANGYAEYVFVILGDAAVKDTIKGTDLIYVIDYRYDTSVDAEETEFYTFKAIVNGAVTTFNTTTTGFNGGSPAANLLWYDVETKDGYIADATYAVDGDDEFEVDSYSAKAMTQNGDVLTVDTTNYLLADGAKIYVVKNANTDDVEVSTVTARSIANTYKAASSFTGTITGVLNDDGEYTALYVQV